MSYLLGSALLISIPNILSNIIEAIAITYVVLWLSVVVDSLFIHPGDYK